MKSIFKITFLAVILMIFSCDNISDINVDPNSSPTARPQEVLTSSIGFLTWVVDGRYNADAFLWGQYWTWGPGVSLGNAARYVAEPDDHNNLWFRAYANALPDMRFLINSDEPLFNGIGKVLTAYTYQGLVDHFGDVPYSEALLGEIADGSNLAPAFDNGSDIYDNLLLLLDEALVDLNSTVGASVAGEDLVFGGDISHWIEFANSLKLRIYMRRSGVTDDGAAVRALVQGGNFLTVNAEVAFDGISGDENPMFANEEAGIGLFYVASNSSLNTLDGLGDPRKEAFYNIAVETGTFEGIDQGDIVSFPFGVKREEFSQASALSYGPAVSTIFMSTWEVMFLRAEAAAKYGTSDDETAMFENAVANNFDHLSVEGAGQYITTLGYDAGASMNERMSKIGVQKWISMNGLQEDEGWIEARRFDTPENSIFTDIDNGIFQTPTRSALSPGVHPSSFLYPESEQSLNPNAPAQRSITDKVFWDN